MAVSSTIIRPLPLSTPTNSFFTRVGAQDKLKIPLLSFCTTTSIARVKESSLTTKDQTTPHIEAEALKQRHRVTFDDLQQYEKLTRKPLSSDIISEIDLSVDSTPGNNVLDVQEQIDRLEKVAERFPNVTRFRLSNRYSDEALDI